MIFRSTQQTATVMHIMPRNTTAIATASRITITLRSISSTPFPSSLPPSFPGFPEVDVGDVGGSFGCDMVGDAVGDVVADVVGDVVTDVVGDVVGDGVCDGDGDIISKVDVTMDSDITCDIMDVAAWGDMDCDIEGVAGSGTDDGMTCDTADD